MQARARGGAQPADHAEAGALRELQVDDGEPDRVAVARGQRFVLGRGGRDHLDAVRHRDQLHQALGDLRGILDHQRVHHLLCEVARVVFGGTHASLRRPAVLGTGHLRRAGGMPACCGERILFRHDFLRR